MNLYDLVIQNSQTQIQARTYQKEILKTEKKKDGNIDEKEKDSKMVKKQKQKKADSKGQES